MGIPFKTTKAERTILVITDFSECSTNAILFVAHLFQHTKLKISLLNTFGNPSERESFLLYIEDILAKKSGKGLKKQTTEIDSIFKERKLNISTHSLPDSLKKGIAKIIEAEDIDMIVVGLPAGKYPSEYLNTCPVLFRGQSKYPVLLVPEKCINKPLRNVVTLNFYSAQQQNILNKDLEHLVNYDDTTNHVINVNDGKTNNTTLKTLENTITSTKKDLIILNSAPGDQIDKALLEYRIQDLSSLVISMLNN